MRQVRSLAAVLFLFACTCSKAGNTPTSPSGGGGSGGNNSPSVSINTSTTHLGYGGTATITATAADADGDQLEYAYTGVGGTVSTSGPTATTATFTAGNQWGPASVTVSVSDGRGGSTHATTAMYIQNPTPPVVDPSIVGCPNRCSTCAGEGLRIVPNERILVTQLVTWEPSAGHATGVDWHYSNVVVDATAGFTFPVPPSSPSYECALDPSEGHYWTVLVYCQRPEPDGRSFVLQWTSYYVP